MTIRNVMVNNQEVAVSETVDGSAALAVLEPSSVEVYEEAVDETFNGANTIVNGEGIPAY